jgi:lipopolysaccharide/colanic/teichoic acid biosynthesis glycosyltransferase
VVKRSIDILLSATGLLLLSPALLCAMVAVKLGSKGPVFFRQERVGRHFRPFILYKFRTMSEDASGKAPQITFGDDPRITRVGRILRKTKIDEFPQLFNVLKGDMSLVGPRPEVRRYVELFEADYETILKVRPGITDLASIRYRREAEILGRAAEPEKEYIERILPEKIGLAKQYVAASSVVLDVKIIGKTMVCLFCDHLPLHRDKSKMLY